MELVISQQDTITVAKIKGALDSATSVQAQDQLLPLAEKKCCLALDLSGCTFISSAGLRVLLMLAKQFTAQGGHLALAGVCDEVRDVMDMTGFISFFRLYQTVDEIADSIRKEK